MAGYTSIKDMFDGGGAGVAGGAFKGGGLISALGNMLFNWAANNQRPMAAIGPATDGKGSGARVSAQGGFSSQGPTGFTGIGSEPIVTPAAVSSQSAPVAVAPVQVNRDPSIPLVQGMAPRPVLRPNPQGPAQNDLTNLINSRSPQTRDMNANAQRIAALKAMLSGQQAPAPMATFDPLIPGSGPDYRPLGYDPLIPGSSPYYRK